MLAGDRVIMIAVLGALKEEITAFTDHLDSLKESTWNHRIMYSGVFGGEDCIVTYTGVGKVFAALTTQYIIDTYHPEVLFFIGIGGAFDPELKIGDILIAENCIQYDVDVTAFGFLPGEIPRPSEETVKKGQSESIRFFHSDITLLKKAVHFTADGCTVARGRICTGDSYVNEELIKENLRMGTSLKLLKGSAVDMESASFAQVCGENSLPFFIARVISDTPDGERAKHFRTFLSESSRKLSQLIEYIIADNGNSRP